MEQHQKLVDDPDAKVPTSQLLSEYKAGRTDLLHTLVSSSASLCVVVSLINHLKPDQRGKFANVWLTKNYLRDLT